MRAVFSSLRAVSPRAFIVIINVYCMLPVSYAAKRVSIEIKAGLSEIKSGRPTCLWSLKTDVQQAVWGEVLVKEDGGRRG